MHKSVTISADAVRQIALCVVLPVREKQPPDGILRILADTPLVEGTLLKASSEMDIRCACTRMGPLPLLGLFVLHLSTFAMRGLACSHLAGVLHLEGLVDWPVLSSRSSVVQRRGPGDSSRCTKQQ